MPSGLPEQPDHSCTGDDISGLTQPLPLDDLMRSNRTVRAPLIGIIGWAKMLHDTREFIPEAVSIFQRNAYLLVGKVTVASPSINQGTTVTIEISAAPANGAPSEVA